MIALKEALVNKNNIQKVIKNKELELFVVDSYNDYFTYINHHFGDKKPTTSGRLIHILTKDDIRQTVKEIGKIRMNANMKVYPLTGFDNEMIEDFKKDLRFKNIDDLIIKYGLSKTKIENIL